VSAGRRSGLRRFVPATRSSGAEDVRASLWFLPSVMGLAALLGTFVLLTVRPDPRSWLGKWGWPGDPSTASTLLQLVASAVMTATTLTLSLTIVALQLASQQFSPRLLRMFARDRRIQASLGVLLSTVVVALATLRGIDPDRPLPVLALGLTWALGLLSVVVLLAFVAHIVRTLRVDTMMVRVHEQTVRALEGAYARWGEGPDEPSDDAPGPEGGVPVPARRSGFVRTTHPEALVQVAHYHGVFLHLELRPGDNVVQGAPVATAWPLDGGRVDVDGLAEALLDGIDFGHERTAEQDVGFGLRQLVDIATKAISPGINDPTTAAEALNYCADLLVRLQGRRLGAQVKRDDDGRPRVVLPDRDYEYYLDLSCAQVRRFGRGMPEVLTALLRLLRDCATGAQTDEQRGEIAHQMAMVLEQVDGDLVEEDVGTLHDFARRVELALAGDHVAAYRDRAGKTRSI
jgi:uncharacterized membrane protein